MIEGTILTYKDKSGQIKGDDGKAYAFNLRALGGGDVTKATPGRRVRFQPEPEGDRDRRGQSDFARSRCGCPETKARCNTASSASALREQAPVSQVASASHPNPSARSAAAGSYRFLNPYNFVRWLRAPQRFDDAETQLLGRCTPPPHDRYVGLSGGIVCQLEAMSPLFISDSELPEPSEEDKKAGHKTYRFFHYDFGDGDEPALPASSLRGMIRSVFEIATNSCYAHFDYGSRLSYHLAAAESLKLVPGACGKRCARSLAATTASGYSTLEHQ